MATQAKSRSASVARIYQMIPVVGPSGGVDLRQSPTLLKPEQAQRLVNFSLTEPGALKVRLGFQQFSTTSLGNGRPQGAKRIYLNTAIPSASSTNVTLIAWDQGVYNLTDSGGWASTTASLSGLSTNPVDFVSDRDLVAALDGSTRLMKSTNGSSWTAFGIRGSSVAPSASSLSSGTLSASTFEVSFTYKDRDLAYESNESPVSSVVLGSTGAIHVSVPNTSDPQVDAIVLYARNQTAGETVRRKVSSAAIQGGANSTYRITDSNWTINDEAPTDHTPPESLSFGVVWKNRWWARDQQVTNRLRFTQLFQPQSWPALFYIDIPFERGDAIEALVPLGDTLLVFGATKIFVILGQTSLDFDVRPTLSSEDGALGFRAVAVIENGVVHAGASGVYVFDGASDQLLSFAIDPAWRDLVAGASRADLSLVDMVYHRPEKELRISVPRRFPSGTFGEWVLDLNQTRRTEEPAWTATDRTIGGYIPWDGPEPDAGAQNTLLSYHSSMAMVFKESIGTSANSSNMTAEYEGPGLTLGTHRGRWTDLRLEYEPHAGALAVEPVIDGVSQGSQSPNIGSGLALYGVAQYGVAQYAGAGRRQAYLTLPLTADGRTFVLKLSYVGQETFKLFSYTPGLVPETQSRSFAE